jgi:hypothetical protein
MKSFATIGAFLFLVSSMTCAHAADHSALRKALTFHASFDGKVDADFAKGDAKLHTLVSRRPVKVETGLIAGEKVLHARGQGRFGDCLHFKDNSGPRIYFKAQDNLVYKQKNWRGTVSLWLRTTPDEDIPKGYTDPLQITPRSALDACFFTEFGIEDPRPFRLGVFSDKTAWNPENKPNKEIALTDRPLIGVENPPFSRDRWTHIVFTWEGFNNGDKRGIAKLYLDGKPQGEMTGWNQQFTWDLAKTEIRLGVKFVGHLDELSCFNRPLKADEIRRLNGLAGGVKSLLNP